MPKIAVYAHDAGGANLLAALMRAHCEEAHWSPFADPSSPAAAIFAAQGFPSTPDTGLPAACDVLFVGTGWQNGRTGELIRAARKRGIPSAAFLDHWVNYRERFGYPAPGWEANLPDVTVTADADALAIARTLELPRPLWLTNVYRRAFEKRYRDLPRTNGDLLFISEPTRTVARTTYGDERYWGFDELEVVATVADGFARFKGLFGVESLRIRLHPSDSPDSYDALRTRYPFLRTVEPSSRDLAESLAEARAVIGIDGMVLAMAAAVNLPVLSLIPTDKRRCVLPQRTILKLQSLDDLPETWSYDGWSRDENGASGEDATLTDLLTALKEPSC